MKNSKQARQAPEDPSSEPISSSVPDEAFPKVAADLDHELETACSLLTIEPMITEAEKQVEKWRQANDRASMFEWAVIREHADRLKTCAAAMTVYIRNLPSGHSRARAALDAAKRYVGRPSDAAEMVETKDAYDAKKIYGLTGRDIHDAVEFLTELKDTFGFAWVDEEIEAPLTRALEELLILMEDGTATMPGTVVTVLKKFIKGHPRGFGRYYTGTDPWPRPAAVIQAEIDERMPYALSWLRHELGDALEQETALKEARTNSGATDDVAPKPNAGDNK